MSSLKELKEVLKDTLEQRGVLKDIRAKVRSEIFQSLEEDKPLKKETTPENRIINALI